MSWNDRAACKGAPIDLFFPGQGQRNNEGKAKAICKGCPVDQDCLSFVLKHEAYSERYGIYAGLSPEERTYLFGGVLDSELAS